MFDLRPVLFVIGVLLAVLAAAMALPALADLANGNEDWRVFFASGAVTLFVAVALILSCRAEARRLNSHQAFLLTTLSWAVVAAFGALPFRFASLGLTFADAYFETMSGLTTTGSTVIVGLDKAPPGILLWRGLLNWLGGVGIIAVAIVVLPMLRIGGMQLFRLESSDKSEKVVPRAKQLAIGIASVYVVLSGVCALFYWIGGMTGFEAIVHAMATLATGGFSTSDNSLGNWDNPTVLITGIVFMFLGGMTFPLFLRAFQGDWRSLLNDRQTQFYVATALAFTVAVWLWHWRANDASAGTALLHAAFNVVSVMTTTGFASTDYSQWGALPNVLFFFLTFVGGCSGSTAGAIKVFRFQILIEVARAHLRRVLSPSGVFVPKYNRRPVPDSVVEAVFVFVCLYLVSFGAVAAGLGLFGLDLVTCLTGSAAALGNVGPGLGDIIGPAGNFSTLPQGAKWLLSFAMLLGRLELLTVLVVLSRSFWRQ